MDENISWTRCKDCGGMRETTSVCYQCVNQGRREHDDTMFIVSVALGFGVILLIAAIAMEFGQ